MDIQLGDILVMKKAHPCGEKRWLVLRTGADFRLRCLGCGHEVMTPRHKAEKPIRAVERKETCTTLPCGSIPRILPYLRPPVRNLRLIRRTKRPTFLPRSGILAAREGATG